MKVLINLVGVALCFGGLVVLMIGPSLFADAGSEKLAGPGVSVWLLDRWPSPGTTMRMEVEAHGGRRAGVGMVRVLLNGEELARKEGQGVHWGNTISGSKSRGAETVEVMVPIPESAVVGTPLPLELEVFYVCAMSAGVGGFDNETFHENIGLEVTPRERGSTLVPRLMHLDKALLALALWIFLLIGLIRFLEGPGQIDGEAGGVIVIGVGVSSAIIGYWSFARPVVATLENPPALDWILAIAWLFGVPYAVWRWQRRRAGV
jgi:hypothetical protein